MRLALIDDSTSALAALREYLCPLEDVELHAFQSGREALAHATAAEFDAVICDYLMPEMDGVEVIRQLRRIPTYKAVPLIMVTSHGQHGVRQRAIEAGATEFLQKPIDAVEFVARVRNLLALRDAHIEMRERVRLLDGAMSLATLALSQREEEIIWRLARAIDARDSHTGEHISRMATICFLIARQLGLPPEKCRTIYLAAPLHDVGKIGIPDAILSKRGRLTATEFAVMQRHVEIGAKILANANSDLLRTAEIIAGGHHERWDGSGYPHGLEGATIPLEARIAAVADVPAERLDELMDRVGELVIAQSRLSQLASSSVDIPLRSVSEDIERLSNELRDTMMMLRMVPITQLFGRFRRLIHDLARETGKVIDLVTEGESTEVDKTVIERLADPLVHLVRNSVDHGLEPPADRRALGKPEAGRITLSAQQAGGEVIITITDDGRGIDRQKVRAKAEANGLIQPGEPLSDQELLQLIFQPGFSTAAKVTNLSGRGVGMDVVKKSVEDLRGSIDVHSESGAGSTISLRIPLTLAIIDGLLVRVGSGHYVIPLSSVEECLELSLDEDLRSRGRSFISLRDSLVPFIRLREIFDTGTQPELHQKVVVVSAGTERVGLVVDQIIGDHQTVIKSMSRLHHGIESFSGATILGDGNLALILDVVHLVTLGQQEEARLRAAV